jgi:hypothetical protein
VTGRRFIKRVKMKNVITEQVRNEIKEWIEGGGKAFGKGLALLKLVSRNPYFVANIERRRDIGKVKHELEKVYRGFRISDFGFRISEKEIKHEDTKIQEQRAKGGERKSDGVRERKSEKGEGARERESGEQNEDQRRDERIVLRREFPFLGNKDCPEEFKILVADMITAHAAYVKAHDRLFDVAAKDNDTCFGVAADLVENYIDNRNMWEELEYYKKTGKIMGNHRIFSERKRREELKKMTADELKNLRINLQRRILYRKKLIDENRDDERIGEWKEDIERMESEKRWTEGTKRRKSGRAKGRKGEEAKKNGRRGEKVSSKQ